jgi:TolB-like protein/Tfp pilus assembly protein PilF
MSKFYDELKRRNVIKAAIAYIVVAWVLLQVLSIVLPSVEAPQWVMKTIMLIMVIAFPIWVFIAWVYEVTPEGLKKTENVSFDQSISTNTNKRLNVLILVGIVVAIAVTLLQPKAGYIASSDVVEYSIAVLPFDDMSAEKDTEWFCDGVTEDILTYLSKVEGLKVISRTSVMQYKDRKKTIPEIAKELGVAFIVEGSVRKHGNDVRITAQLIKANDEHLWADNYSGTMDNVFKLQSDVSQQIVQQLKIKISPEVKKKLEAYPTDNIEAYEAYLKGRSFMDKFDPENAKIAREFFEKAIELDPNYADAYAELGYANLFNGPKDSLIVFKNIDKALKLNPNSSRANSYKGFILNFMQKKPDEAFNYLEKAIKLNPNDAKAHDMLAAYYVNLRKGEKKDNLDKALYHINQAVTLDPFSVQSKAFNLMVLTQRGEVDKAEELFNKNIAMFSEDNKENAIRNMVAKRIELSKKENQTEAIQIYEDAIKKYPSQKANLTQLLAGSYDGIYNDQDAYLKYAKQAFEMDSTLTETINQYHTALVESGEFETAKKLMASDNYKKTIEKRNQLLDLQYYYYHKGDYKKSNEILEDSTMTNQNFRKALQYAQTKDLEKLNTVKGKLSNVNKAFVFAILKQRDSMYFYLNKEDINDQGAQFPNSRSEFDPYRKEPRYIEFLKKHKFPIEEQKN